MDEFSTVILPLNFDKLLFSVLTATHWAMEAEKPYWYTDTKMNLQRAISNYFYLVK